MRCVLQAFLCAWSEVTFAVEERRHVVASPSRAMCESGFVPECVRRWEKLRSDWWDSGRTERLQRVRQAVQLCRCAEREESPNESASDVGDADVSTTTSSRGDDAQCPSVNMSGASLSAGGEEDCSSGHVNLPLV